MHIRIGNAVVQTEGFVVLGGPLAAVTLGGGGWLYVKSDRDAREAALARHQAELAQEVNESLNKAMTLREQAKSAKVGRAGLFAQAREQGQTFPC